MFLRYDPKKGFKAPNNYGTHFKFLAPLQKNVMYMSNIHIQ